MVVNFTQPILLMPDGSYVVTTLGPAYPYNVLPSDPMWGSIQDWLAAGNKAEEYRPPEAKPVDPEMQLTSEIIADYIDTQKATQRWKDRLTDLKAGKLSDR
jgi:hypothetical protein